MIGQQEYRIRNQRQSQSQAKVSIKQAWRYQNSRQNARSQASVSNRVQKQAESGYRSTENQVTLKSI